MPTPNHRPGSAPGSRQSVPLDYRFAATPCAATFDRRLKPIEKVVLDALLFYAREKDHATVADATLARDLGVSVNTITAALASLKKHGYTAHQKVAKHPSNATGRRIDLVFRIDPATLPTTLPGAHVRLAESPPSAVRSPQPVGDSPPCTTPEESPAHWGMTPQPVGDKVEGNLEGLSVCPSVSHARRGAASPGKKKPRETTDVAEADVKAAVQAFEALTDTVNPRMRREMAELLAEVGLEVVKEAAFLAEYDFVVKGKVRGNLYNYGKGIARRMHKDGGVPPEPRRYVEVQAPVTQFVDPEAGWQ